MAKINKQKLNVKLERLKEWDKIDFDHVLSYRPLDDFEFICSFAEKCSDEHALFTRLARCVGCRYKAKCTTHWDSKVCHYDPGMEKEDPILTCRSCRYRYTCRDEKYVITLIKTVDYHDAIMRDMAAIKRWQQLNREEDRRIRAGENITRMERGILDEL